MSEEAEALGIPRKDLLRALTLMRDLRLICFRENLDPRAMRIVLIVANLVDLHFARQKLNQAQLKQLEKIATDLYTQARYER